MHKVCLLLFIAGYNQVLGAGFLSPSLDGGLVLLGRPAQRGAHQVLGGSPEAGCHHSNALKSNVIQITPPGQTSPWGFSCNENDGETQI